MAPVQHAEQAMIRAQVNANRAMREAAQQTNNEALNEAKWEAWQSAEKRAMAARQRWLILKAQETKQAA